MATRRRMRPSAPSVRHARSRHETTRCCGSWQVAMYPGQRRLRPVGPRYARRPAVAEETRLESGTGRHPPIEHLRSAQGGLVVKRGRMLAPAPMQDSSVAAPRSRALPWPTRADRCVGRLLQRRRASASFTPTGCSSVTTTDTHLKAEAQTQAAAETQEAVTRKRQPDLGRRTGCAAAPPRVARATRRSSTPDWAGRPGSRGRTGWR